MFWKAGRVRCMELGREVTLQDSLLPHELMGDAATSHSGAKSYQTCWCPQFVVGVWKLCGLHWPLLPLQIEQQCWAWMNSGLLGDLEGYLSTEYWAGERRHDSPYKKAVLSQSFQCDPQEGKDMMNFCVKNNSTHSPYSSFQGQVIFYCDLAQVTVAWLCSSLPKWPSSPSVRSKFQLRVCRT